MAQWLERAAGAEGPGFKRKVVHGIFQNLSVHPAVNGYPTLVTAGEVEGGGREVAPYLRYTPASTCGLSNSHFATRPLAMGATFTIFSEQL